MKKLMYVLLTMVLILGLAACGSSGGGSGSEWTRTGPFTDENKNVLLIVKPDDGEHDDMWAVSVILANGDVHGWFLKQKGETLSGNLNSEIDDTDVDYIVTISEEGEKSLMMAGSLSNGQKTVKTSRRSQRSLLKSAKMSNTSQYLRQSKLIGQYPDHAQGIVNEEPEFPAPLLWKI